MGSFPPSVNIKEFKQSPSDSLKYEKEHKQNEALISYCLGIFVGVFTENIVITEFADFVLGSQCGSDDIQTSLKNFRALLRTPSQFSFGHRLPFHFPLLIRWNFSNLTKVKYKVKTVLQQT